MSPLKQLCWSAVGQAPWVQVGFEPQSREERTHWLPWAEAPGSPYLRYLPGAEGVIVDPLLWSAQTVACSLGPCTSLLCHVAVSKVQGQKRGPTEALFLRAE